MSEKPQDTELSRNPVHGCSWEQIYGWIPGEGDAIPGGWRGFNESKFILLRQLEQLQCDINTAVMLLIRHNHARPELWRKIAALAFDAYPTALGLAEERTEWEERVGNE